jgi:tetratricopeptide (TPR) repeat protein
MTDGVFPDRLTQLRARWDADPSSRIFLQLAEEYRHLGRIQDALMVLDRGLKEHPGYLSALVAKGRCHLEIGEGDAARVVLERVVKQDATQMVANKLLVRAFLETGDPVKARERLDLYSLLNDSDPEIEELRRRIRQLERPTPPERPAPEADPFALEPPAAPAAPAPAVPAVSAPAALDIFDLAPPAPPGGGGDDIFDFAPARSAPPAPPVQAVPSAAADDLFALEPLPAPASGIPAPIPPEEEETLVLEEALFPGLASRDSRRRYLDALGSEGLFAFEAPPAPAPAAPPSPEAAEEASWLDEATAVTPAAPPAPAPEPLMPAIFAPEPPASLHEPEATTAEELWSEEPEPLPEVETRYEPEPEPEPELETVVEYEPELEEEAPVEDVEEEVEETDAAEVATATLGELYFRQGHYTEAERIFREVLEREPGNVAATAGLYRVSALGPQPEAPRLDARRLLTGYRPDPTRRADAEARSRKVFLLNRYLDRLRQGSAPDVS